VPHPLRLDHVAVAVHSIKDALRLYRDALELG
jgi:catechol 2,3-dioxygenase-like lactoylglutathione lyase family enzyme